MQENPREEFWGAWDSEHYMMEDIAEMECHDDCDDERQEKIKELIIGIYRSTQFTIEATHEAFSKILKKER